MSTGEHSFTIPRSSYIASLLTVLGADALSNYGKGVFVGGYPGIWHNDKPDLITELLTRKDTNERVLQYSNDNDLFFKKRDAIIKELRNDTTTADITSEVSTIPVSLPKIKFEMPRPETKVNIDEQWIEEENKRFRKRLKRFAKKSTGGAIRASRSKIKASIFKSYEAGEIIRIDKVLVLVMKPPGSGRVSERWREYIAVLRKTDLVAEPLMLQFYDIDKSPEESHPRVGFRLNSQVKADFYSYLDKTISLTVLEKVQYILRLNNQTNSFRWLYFIKETLGVETEINLFNIYVPRLGYFIEVEVPESVFANHFRSNQNIVVTKHEAGYEIECDGISQYLKQFLPKGLSRGWFWFRKYDRLEWAGSTGEQLFIQNMLFLQNHQLEYREYEASDVPPRPIEGFLGRLTNVSGKEKSVLRDFHKILYFYTNRNLLFFTKYYRAVPPPQGGDSLVNEVDLFGDGHMEWLESDFDGHNKAIVEEIGRRTDMIVKAEGVIDMADICEVNISHSTQTQNLVHCALWYSKPELASEKEIVDSCFEIQLKWGALIKLQAQNRAARDIWITSLNDMCRYWKRRQTETLANHIQISANNIERLLATQYADSNASDEINFLESQHAIACGASIPHLLPNMLVIKSGYLYEKNKKHASFNHFYVVLCPGYLIIYHTFRRSRGTGTPKLTAFYEHYITIPLSQCYVYTGKLTELDLLNCETRTTQVDTHSVPRVYPDGWKSMEEDCELCFTLWFGKKRNISHYEKQLPKLLEVGVQNEKNPGMVTMIRKLGITGKSIMFTANSRQERDRWTMCILSEMDRLTGQM